ncbi:MAG TPA: orotidine-5'-phosphate decarboxylase [Myxococcaceae bacterium]|nr:orotidine-5'-phosphate decarboxylase [Myxococcaceae bacterium]
MSFVERLEERVLHLNTRLCVGIDPRPEWHPSGVSLQQHVTDLLEACAPFACAVKPQLAFFEAQGLEGMRALESVLAQARELGLPVIVDGKRGDIGTTAEAYARAWLAGTRAGCALTVNPYLGRDTLEPMLTTAKEAGGALFCLVKTSNPGAGDLQDLPTPQGTVAEVVASWVTDWNGEGTGLGPVGSVVGATRPGELARFRARLPRSVLLLPGLGAQGGKPEELAPAFLDRGLGAVASASRSVEYASRRADFAQAAADAARELRDALNRALGT